MNDNADELQKKLEELEAGKFLNDCLDGLETSDAELLQLASTLREFEPPSRDPSIVQAQQRQIKQQDRANKTMTGNSIFQRKVWSTPAFALVALVLFGCFVASAIGIGGLTIFRLDQRGNDSARVQALQGVLEVQSKDSTWQTVSDNDQLAPGSRVRTGELSSAELRLDDGSVLRLGSSTEVTLDQMDRFLFGKRIVRITQWYGTTTSDVQPNTRNGSLYEVRTASATITAKGTAFTVWVGTDLFTRVSVTEGNVDLTSAQQTVSLAPGQTSSVAVNEPPTQPTLMIRGEGVLTGSEDGWVIGGQAVLLQESTHVIGDPQSGDLVTFEGQQLSDGSILAEQITVLMPPQPQTFTITGELENIATSGLVLNGKFIALNPQTAVDTNLQNGDVVIVQGTIQEDDSWLASSVYSTETGQPFQFMGVVQEMDENRWTISSLAIDVDENTTLDSGILTGNVVIVNGWIQDNGNWLAGSIQKTADEISSFQITGIVESIDPWIVSGKPIQTRPWTLIGADIQEGDTVNVQGPVLEDGTWVAAAIIEVAEPSEDVSLEFTGVVNSTDPWVISGIQLQVDEKTQSSGEIKTGSLVTVRATLQSNGLWHADEISLIVPDTMGCVTFASVVTAVEGDIISLENGMTINLADVEQVDGVIEVEAVVLITRCMTSDGTVTIPLIQVLSNPSVEPTPTVTATQTVTNTPAPQSIILPNCYKITFLGFTENGDGTSTWTYRVDELSCAQDLSNWVLELPACTTVVGAAPSPWEVVHPDPNIQLNGIKWQTGAGFESGEFSVTLSGDLTTGTVSVGAKGPDVAIGQIIGPACDVPTTTTPTVTFTPSPTATLATDIAPTLTLEPSSTVPPAQPTQPAPPASSGTILVTDNDQTLTFTCNGNAVEVRGNANTVTLLGSCSSILVTGNGNHVFWQSGSPVITDRGNENTISQR
jgi:hypothetical protein